MITKNDLLLLLSDISRKGVDTSKVTSELISSREVPLSVIQFVNDNRQLDLTAFYEKLRKSYNNKHSKLYISILKEITDPELVLTTLSSLLLQIFIFSKNVSDKNMFFKHSRANEISYVLNKYFVDYDLTNCLKLLRLIKTDLLAIEVVNRRRTM